MSRFTEQLQKRVLVFDGAMGTSIHEIALDLQRDYLGRENCTEVLVLTRPDVIQSIHESFLSVGADAVETDTFGANPIVLGEFELADRTREINRLAAEVARAACDKFTTGDKPRFVVGSIGPGTKLVTLGFTDWDTMFASYREQARGLIEGGVDVLLIETAQDLLQVKCAIAACLEALDEAGKSPAQVPIMTQVTIETSGTMLLGTEIAAAAAALAPYPILSLGLNCATGPVEMGEYIHWLSRHWPRPISVLPNAGLPALVEGKTVFPLQPDPFADALLRFVEEYGVNIVGGCCGTTPAHIRALAQRIGTSKAARKPGQDAFKPALTSLYAPTEYRQETSILNIGERCNASGSRAFKKLLETDDLDAIVSLARQQVREGSHVLDVNVDYAGRDNPADMAKIVSQLTQQVHAPLMLDSTQPATIEAGLKVTGGKCVINSANLEDGEEKFAVMCRLARKYGAGLVLGCIDEDKEEAMARTADRKLAIATRLHRLATQKYGLAEEDLMFDPLVLPISTGMDKDRRSALETIEGTRRIAAAFPRCQITCGLSNVSFGLAPAARVVLNSVFLHELVAAGMTSAIVHVSKILPRNKIPAPQWDAALDLIYDRRESGGDPLQRFIDLFQGDDAKPQATAALSSLPVEERLQRHIIDGEKQDLVQTLEEARTKYDALTIINDHLLAGMKVVGDLFGSGQMQLPFVLQSAEVMKAAVAHLQPYMDKVGGPSKGSIVLATVKGDVHDIGKNLVDIILSNNGYTVHNLGIKQPISAIIDALQRHGADAIGLSGLLVKSVSVMEENLQELNSRGIAVPVLLGGAALSKHYCESHLRAQYRGRVYHGQDAFEGLRIMDHLRTGKLAALDAQIEERLAKRAAVVERTTEAVRAGDAQTSTAVLTLPARSDVANDVPVPSPPFWGTKVVDDLDLDEVYPFINKVALFRGQWQFKKGRLSDEQYAALLRDTVEPVFARLARQCKLERILTPKVVYGYFPCSASGDDLVIYNPRDHDREVERFTFPRQRGVKRLCISDYFRPIDAGVRDVIAMTCVTVGPQVTARAKALFDSDQYQEYLYLHGLGVETAEALAELWHKKVREELGIAGEDAPDIRQLFTQHYRGSRYSFGYPACPDLADEEKLFHLLEPQRIGCTLTENFQIEPEQSTSAIIVHHPQAKYFSV